jgi:hypothetical protein
LRLCPDLLETQAPCQSASAKGDHNAAMVLAGFIFLTEPARGWNIRAQRL